MGHIALCPILLKLFVVNSRNSITLKSDLKYKLLLINYLKLVF